MHDVDALIKAKDAFTLALAKFGHSTGVDTSSVVAQVDDEVVDLIRELHESKK